MMNVGKMGTMVFEPGYLKVEPGDKVKFLATDPGHDTVSVHVPAGAEGWTGGINNEVTVTLDKEGVYIYKCNPHAVLAMVGVIQVGNATNLAEAQAAAKTLSATFATNKDRLDKYMAEVK
ncbi:MAG: pseudoazurin [Candidatus Thiodiazotropha sp. (ex Ctena orbiculata)]|nr:pseudoazurin [Candidatus Thiodiazotropha taylori]